MHQEKIYHKPLFLAFRSTRQSWQFHLKYEARDRVNVSLDTGPGAKKNILLKTSRARFLTNRTLARRTSAHKALKMSTATLSQTSTSMQFLSTLAAVLAASASGAYSQTSCASVVTDVARQVSEMQTFNNRVPPPSSSNRSDCTTAKSLKSGIDAYRSGLASDPGGCIVSCWMSSISSCVDTSQGVYANTILAGGVFDPQYTILGKFVAACGSL
ncbi:hypothetical protein C8R47DRAFT_515400 [Mycena vitilis]|nr:hypothetical protein C8R47DRAFT_515400 [Mycena vitilis]